MEVRSVITITVIEVRSTIIIAVIDSNLPLQYTVGVIEAISAITIGVIKVKSAITIDLIVIRSAITIAVIDSDLPLQYSTVGVIEVILYLTTP